MAELHLRTCWTEKKNNFQKLFFAIAFFALIFNPIAANAVEVTPQQYNSVVNYERYLNDKIKKLETDITELKTTKNQNGAGGTSGDETVDLNAMGTTTADVSTKGEGVHAPSPTAPGFKAFFDLNLVRRPSVPGENLAFDNYHNYLFFEITPTPDFSFSFEVTQFLYYELDYQASKKLTLRAGKIFIPFDDVSSQSPHFLFGGRVGIARLSPDRATTFLPQVWADYGVGARYLFKDTTQLSLLGDLYIVNGFGQGGQDPLNPLNGVYPNTTTVQGASNIVGGGDSHAAKAVGGRLHALIANTLGLGVSAYTGQYSSDDTPPSEGIFIFGFDSQLRITPTTEGRFGFASMSIGVPNDSFTRGGYYFELGQRFGRENKFKGLARYGGLQFDNRVISPLDQNIVGGTILYQPNFIQFSVEESIDTKQVPGKAGYSYTDLRMVMAF